MKMHSLLWPSRRVLENVGGKRPRCGADLTPESIEDSSIQETPRTSHTIDEHDRGSRGLEEIRWRHSRSLVVLFSAAPQLKSRRPRSRFECPCSRRPTVRSPRPTTTPTSREGIPRSGRICRSASSHPRSPCTEIVAVEGPVQGRCRPLVMGLKGKQALFEFL
jgi:hypothetical protein